MSSINTQIQNSGYYQLNSTGTGSTGTNTTGNPAAVTPSLAAALGNSSSSSSSYSDAVLLDLSPAAQKYLSTLNQQAAGSTTTPTTPSDAGGDNFVLSSKQQLALSAILDKYKDAPYTQDTFDSIQNDLHDAGLGPDQLSAKEKSTSFSSTAVLIDALNGGNGTTPGSTPTSQDTLNTKSANFIQDVIGQWKKVSSDYAAKNVNEVAAIGAGDAAS